MSLKLDLHTHCQEATWFCPSAEAVEPIIAAVKKRGLDGIAITEHDNLAYAYEIKEIVERRFANEILIIPGREIEKGSVEIIELHLSCGGIFRFIAHPGHPYIVDYTPYLDGVHGVEIRNNLHDREMRKGKIQQMAETYGLLLLSNSDAHDLEDIGRYYNELSLEELCSRAM